MSTLSVDVSNGIATLTFNRPKSLNAITAEGDALLPELLDAVSDCKIPK